MADRKSFARFALYGVLIGFALFYLAPLVVVLLNSVRSFEEIAQSCVLGLPGCCSGSSRSASSCRRR